MAVTVSREELSRYLGKAAWPLALPLPVEFAKNRAAPASVVEMLERLPNRMYMSDGDLWREFQARSTPHG